VGPDPISGKWGPGLAGPFSGNPEKWTGSAGFSLRGRTRSGLNSRPDRVRGPGSWGPWRPPFSGKMGSGTPFLARFSPFLQSAPLGGPPRGADLSKNHEKT